MNYVRLPLEGCKNTRDLGGYGTNINGKKGVTKWNRFLRSDCVFKLTENDMDFLKKYNLKTIIDLRSNLEIENEDNPFRNKEEYNFHHISLADNIAPNSFATIDTSRLKSFLLDIYIDGIDNKKAEIKEIFDIFMKMEDGESVIFHCTAGKDRTGIVSMLILGIVGVENQDIISNYEQTETNLKNDPVLLKMKEKIHKEQLYKLENLSNSNKENMEQLLDYFYNKYKSFQDYFITLGYSFEDIELLRNKISQ